MRNENLDVTSDVLYRVKRGLAGYVSYLAACEMNAAFSEYVLYEPTLRILTAQGFVVRSEAECPGYPRTGREDVKRLDFVAEGHGSHFAMEVKWARDRRPKVHGDLDKLHKYCKENANARGFLCVFGRKSSLIELSLPQELRERGNGIYAEFGVTKFGCRIYQAVDSK